MGIRWRPTTEGAPYESRACIAKGLLAASLVAAVIGLFPMLAQAAPPTQAQPDGQTIFQTKCQSCHSIGHGRMAGPDLKGVTSLRDKSWLIEFISGPDKVIGRGDPIAKELVGQYGMPMPNMGVSPREAEAIIEYIRQKSGEETAEHPAGATDAAAQAQPLPLGSPAAGRDLFTGATSFQNGGVACIACHNVSGVGAWGGGNIGKDLTLSYTTLGQQGLDAAIRTAPFPGMKEAFVGHSLKDREVGDLLAFFQDSSAGNVPAQTAATFYFPTVGVVGFVMLLAVISLIGKGRLRGVRQPLVKGGAR